MPKFHCIHCGQHIDAPDEMSGSVASCPSCGGEIHVPGTLKPPLPHPIKRARCNEKETGKSGGKVSSFIGSTVLFLVVVFIGRSCGSIVGKHSAELQKDKWKESIAEQRKVKNGKDAGSSLVSIAPFVRLNKGGVIIEVPPELSTLSAERDSGGEIKLLEKYTAVHETRSIIIKHFVFESPRRVSPREAADMTEGDIRTQQGYSANRSETSVSGLPALLLDARYDGMGQKVEQSILYFSQGNELWEIHLFGVNDGNEDDLKAMKNKVYRSIKVGS